MEAVSDLRVESLEQALAPLQFSRMLVRYESQSDSVLPGFKGSTLRGAMGWALKRALCAELPAVCDSCQRPQDCSYSYLFETNLRNYAVAGGTEIPHPFVLTPAGGSRRRYRKGDGLRFELVLIGEGCRFLPYFLLALAEAGEEGLGLQGGGFRMVDARAWRPAAPPVRVFRIGEGFFSDPGPPLSGQELIQPWLGIPINRARIRFVTPTRLKSQGRLAESIPFEILVRRLLRRLGDLSLYHHGRPFQVDFRRIVELASQVRASRSDLRWRDWDRYSSRQERLLKMGGLVGEVEYEGDLSPFAPLLAVGEWVHVGKGTSLGLGQFRVTEISAGDGDGSHGS